MSNSWRTSFNSSDMLLDGTDACIALLDEGLRPIYSNKAFDRMHPRSRTPSLLDMPISDGSRSMLRGSISGEPVRDSHAHLPDVEGLIQGDILGHHPGPRRGRWYRDRGRDVGGRCHLEDRF